MGSRTGLHCWVQVALVLFCACGCEGGNETLPPSGAAAPTTQPVTIIPNGGKPMIKVDNAVHDFGTTWAGPLLKHTFVISNQGDGPLEIQGIKPDCGCTTAGAYPKSIAPGQSAGIPFSLDSKRIHDKYRKSILITTNDPVTPTLELALSGMCKHYVYVSPSSASFGLVTGDQPLKRAVTIKNNVETPLKLTMKPQPSDSRFKVELTERMPGFEYELQITATPPFKPGMMTGNVSIATNNPAQSQIDIGVFGRVPERLDVLPVAVVIPVTPNPPADAKGNRIVTPVQFRNYGKTKVAVLGAETDDPMIEARITAQTPGEAYTIALQIPTSYSLPKEERMLTLYTDDSEKPEIRIPIRRSDMPATKPAESLIGKPSPVLKVRTTGGKDLDNESFAQYTATVLDFVATDCPHCRKQLPLVEQLRREYEKSGVRFVSICIRRQGDVTPQKMAAWMQELGAGLELVPDMDGRLGSLFQIASLPTAIVVDKTGRVQMVGVGANKAVRLRAHLNQLLGSPVPTQPAK